MKVNVPAPIAARAANELLKSSDADVQAVGRALQRQSSKFATKDDRLTTDDCDLLMMLLAEKPSAERDAVAGKLAALRKKISESGNALRDATT